MLPKRLSSQSAALALFTPLLGAPLVWYIPAVISLGYLAKLWWAGELYGVRRAIFVAWFFIALAIQLESGSAWIWIAGFAGQVALSVALVLKEQIEGVF